MRKWIGKLVSVDGEPSLSHVLFGIAVVMALAITVAHTAYPKMVPDVSDKLNALIEALGLRSFGTRATQAYKKGKEIIATAAAPKSEDDV